MFGLMKQQLNEVLNSHFQRPYTIRILLVDSINLASPRKKIRVLQSKIQIEGIRTSSTKLNSYAGWHDKD
jgi:hypothetical protein